jgi:peptide-methionine (R)-S-oxide reductase
MTHRPSHFVTRFVMCLATLAACTRTSTESLRTVAPAAAMPASAAAAASDAAVPPVGERLTLSNDAWRQRLTPEQYHVLREEGTERAFTGAYWDNHDRGTYVCSGCGAPLFSSEAKFDSGTGWPSYWQPIEPGRVEERRDETLGMARVEVHCARCGGHLGHVFDDGPQPTGKRYCIDSVSLSFHPAR